MTTTPTTATTVRPSRRRPTRTVIALAVAIALALVVAVLLWVRDHRRDQEWEHGGDDVDVQARIEATGRDGFGDALVAAGVPSEPGPTVAGQMVVVQASWDSTPDPDGTFAFILLDDRLDPPLPLRGYGGWGPGGPTGTHWAGSYEDLSEHYSWLARTASAQTSDGWTDTTEAVGLSAVAAGDGTLAYWFDKDDLPTAHPERDLLLAVVFVDADGVVRWARKVPLTGLG
ncbi:MAG: hypothetical protein JWN91_4591 [Nocardioides sp.]|nr:hypothetical protein [Nocardioides sp.]